MSLEFTECSLLQFDEGAHFQEHSLEVLLPFLQVQNPDLQIVPVALALNSLSRIETVAAHIAAVAERAGKRPLILVSSDMSHYVDSRVAERLDNMAIEEMIKVDGSGLFNTVHKEGISMCGVLPAAVALKAAKIMGASYGELLDYTHSGQVSNDDSSVVGYAGVALF
jgi:AmmeMemoRadiSam system protein B